MVDCVSRRLGDDDDDDDDDGGSLHQRSSGRRNLPNVAKVTHDRDDDCRMTPCTSEVSHD
jgi:hypothetical protein